MQVTDRIQYNKQLNLINREISMKSGKRKKVTILFTCVGRRVGLARAFQQAAKSLKIPCTTIGTDISSFSPALYACDRGIITEPVGSKKYISEILSIVKKHKVDLIIPTIDTDLLDLSRHGAEFQSLGAKVMVSSDEVVEICQDKRKAYHFLIDHKFDTPRTVDLSKVKKRDLTFPVFFKPWNGSASRGNAIARNLEEFKYLSKRIPNCIVQEYMDGQEITCDVYVDFQMRVRAVVPRKRMEVRAGEVSKSQTVRMPDLMDRCRRLVEELGAGPGVITIQGFLLKNNKFKFVEINPRFGGGSPLSIAAGADFPRWILSELMGIRPVIAFQGWRDSFYMFRYDEAIWVKETEIITAPDCHRPA